MTVWNEKPYHSLDYCLKETFGKKVYKLALDGGMTCPNRDGTLGTGGCIFCSAGGSGDFAAPRRRSMEEQLAEAKERLKKKLGDRDVSYIAYFQSYTNTYAPLPYLEELFSSAAAAPEIAALSIGTRPDCLPPETVDLLARLNRSKPVWVELGLQTVHEDTARFIRRGYSMDVFLDAFRRLKEAGIQVIVHVILGLPGETREMMLETVRTVGRLRADGIKLQLLHVLSGTDLGRMYQENPFPVMSLEEYLDLVIDSIALLPPEVVIHRISGDGPKKLLLAPLWSADKRLVLNSLTRRLKERGIFQGCALDSPSVPLYYTEPTKL